MATMKDLYDSWLDELTLEELNLGLTTSRVVEECDPTAYRCGFADYADSAEFICDDCGETFSNTDHLSIDHYCVCLGCAGSTND